MDVVFKNWGQTTFFVAPFTAAYDLKLAGGRRNKGLDIISLVTGPGQLHLHIARRWRQKIYVLLDLLYTHKLSEER